MRTRLTAAALFALTLPLVAQRGGNSSLRMPGQVAISPDGALVAWTIRGREGSTLHLTTLPDADPAKEKLVSPSDATNCSNSAPVWSPDSKTLAYTSDCTSKDQKPGQQQIFLYDRATGQSRQLTHVTGNINQAAWSPDGKSIAFLFVENATRSAGALDAMKPFAGVIGEDNIEIQGVYGVDIVTGKGGWLIPATPKMYTYEFAWSPDSHELASISIVPPGENNWWIAKLYTTSVVNSLTYSGSIPPEPGMQGSNTHLIFDPVTTQSGMHGLQIAVPRWSPDGKRIAFIGGLMSDQGSTGGDVWVVNADGHGEAVDVSANVDFTPTAEAWIDNHTIGTISDRRGHIIAPDFDVNTRKEIPNSRADLGEVSLSGGPIKNYISWSNDFQFAFVMSSPTKAPEIYVGSLDKPRQLTHLNDGITSSARTESVEWTNEGFHVQGWLTYPANFDPAKKYPIIVTVHGGPSADVGARFSGSSQWAERGYFEFQPNPRGSFGQGEKFTMANRKDFGYGDLRDILAGLDAVEKKVPAIDQNREGLTGWSYGGFMSMFAATQTGRFKAIVAGAGISNWQSYYGENSIDQWMIPFFGASVYDDPAVYAKSSAITFIKKTKEYKTPMLIIVGDRDGECPAPQSFEMWHALKAMGVKTQLVVYPNEGHGFRNPEHIRDRAERTAKWFADNMPAK